MRLGKSFRMGLAPAGVVLCMAAVGLGPRTELKTRTQAGLWPLMRHDAQNTARADVTGRFTGPPVEVWRCGGLPPGSSFIQPVLLPRGEAFLRQVGAGLDLVTEAAWCARPRVSITAPARKPETITPQLVRPRTLRFTVEAWDGLEVGIGRTDRTWRTGA